MLHSKDMEASLPYPNHVKQWIKRQGYTIQEVAEETGIPRRTLTYYLSGKAPIPRQSLEKIADTIGCDIDELIVQPLQLDNQQLPLTLPHEQAYENITVKNNSEVLQSISSSFITPQHEFLLQTGTRDWSVWAGMKLMQILKLIDSTNGQNQSCEETCEEIQTLLDQEIKMLDDAMPQDDTRKEHLISRRQALIMVASLPSTISSWTTIKTNGPVAEEFLPQCAASITACWHLLQEKGLEAVEEILPTFMPVLIMLALHPSKYQIAAAHFATQANILRAILAKHRLKDHEREKYAHEAVRCSQFSCDKKLQAAALMTLGYTYVFCLPLRPLAAIETFQAALQILEGETSLLRSDIYIALADAYAQCGKEREALEAITLAQNHFPSYPEHDPSFLYADCSLPVLYQWEGKMYLHLAEHHTPQKYYEKAWNAFGQAMQAQPLHQRGISEVTIDQANTARGMGELSIYTEHLRRGVEMAVTLKSQRRYQEAVAVYLQTPDHWLAEPAIQTLAKNVFGGKLPRRG